MFFYPALFIKLWSQQVSLLRDVTGGPDMYIAYLPMARNMCQKATRAYETERGELVFIWGGKRIWKGSEPVLENEQNF